jgi:hypothetical protein
VGRQVEQNAIRKNQESYEKKLQYQEAMGMYLEKEKVIAQCQKTQSQNQQNLSVKNPKHQADIKAALSHAQRGARLERYNQVPTRSCHPHT